MRTFFDYIDGASTGDLALMFWFIWFAWHIGKAVWGREW